MNKFENILLFGIGINKFEITNWSEKKPKLLDLINLSDDDVIECQSDYFKYQARPPYLQQFGNILHDDLSNLVNTFTELLHERYQGEIPVKNLETWQLWSQRYTLGHYHGAHNHGMMNISCVLYVDFDVNEHKPTKFYSPFTNPYYGTVDVAVPPVEEGNIIAFPSTMLHECPPSQSKIPRTIMSFNIPMR